MDQKTRVILDLIKDKLGGNIGYRKSQDDYCYNSVTFGSAFKIIKYLNKYHLLSNKYIDYLRWRKTYALLQSKSGLTDNEKARILKFASASRLSSINRLNTFSFSPSSVLRIASQCPAVVSGTKVGEMGNSNVLSCLNKGSRKFSTSLLIRQSSDFSLQLNKSALNPNWITGFADGESSFIISIIKNIRYKSGWMVKPSFRIQLHKKDYDLLVRIQTFFGVGNIIIDNNANAVHYAVYSLTDLTNVIIP